MHLVDNQYKLIEQGKKTFELRVNDEKRKQMNKGVCKMDKYGIYNITDKTFKYRYDMHYKNVALKLKKINNETECNRVRELERKS